MAQDHLQQFFWIHTAIATLQTEAVLSDAWIQHSMNSYRIIEYDSMKVGRDSQGSSSIPHRSTQKSESKNQSTASSRKYNQSLSSFPLLSPQLNCTDIFPIFPIDLFILCILYCKIHVICCKTTSGRYQIWEVTFIIRITGHQLVTVILAFQW